MSHLRWAALLGLALLTACGSSDAATPAPAPDRVEVTIEHSRFLLSHTEFASGQTVTFVIRNDDPIDHEFIVGEEEVHAEHEAGRQRHHHGKVPGEITVPSGTTRSTTYTFPQHGQVEYACHLPGHFDYGMAGAFSVS